MLTYITEALGNFRSIFPRHTTWLIFCMVVLGFLGASEMIGISSFCRFWGSGDKVYNAVQHFFRSSGWSVNMLIVQWAAFVLS